MTLIRSFGWQKDVLLQFFNENGARRLNVQEFISENDVTDDFFQDCLIPCDINRVHFDSREVASADMFFAINSPAHEFVVDSFIKGSRVCVVHQKYMITARKKFKKILAEAVHSKKLNLDDFLREFSIVVVADPFKMFQKLAAFRRGLSNATFIAITGSVGKTTSKEALVHYLSKAKQKVSCAPKNYNNLLGVSFLLANLDLDSQFVIVEIGTSNFGEIKQLAKLVMPDYSLITHIAPAHLEFLKTVGNIALEKADVFKYTKKCAFFNSSYWYSNLFEKICIENNIPFRCFCNEFDVVENDSFAVRGSLEVLKNSWRLIFQVLNVPFIDDDFGMNVAGRSLVFDTKFNNHDLQIIDSAYNANLASMVDSIQFFNDQFALLMKKHPNKNFKQVAVLGDMGQIGDHTIRYHQVLSCYLKNVCLLLVGSKMTFLHEKHSNSFWFENNDALIDFLQKNVNYNALILVKGSSFNKLSTVVNFFKDFAV